MKKKVFLKRLSLENFKGRTMAFELSDGRVVMRGTNEAGKSTFCNAFFWLILGVDAQDRANYELYDSNLEFTPENAIPAAIEALFDIDGVEYTFKRVAKQKWVRKRGKAEYEKASSDDYTFYIDGLAVSANVYKARVETLFAPIDKLKLMLNIRYYQTLDWKKLRKHFSDMVGIIDKSELKGDYSAIEPLIEKFEKDPTFKGNAVEAVKDKLKKQMPKTRIKELEAEIKGMKSMLPSLDGVEEAKKECDIKRDRISEIDKEILGIGKANIPFEEKRRCELQAISEKKMKLNEHRSEWERTQRIGINNISKQLADIESENEKIRKNNERINQQRLTLERDIASSEQHLEFLKGELERLRKENNDIKARTFDENQLCSYCGQPLPYEKVTEIREKFYSQREADHKACVDRGLKTKAQVESLEKAISEKKSQKDALPANNPLSSIDELHEQLALAEDSIIPFEQSDCYASLSQEIADMESNLTVVPEVNSTELMAEKKRLNDEIAELNGIISRKAERERGEVRIKTKEQEQSECASSLAYLEGLFDKCVEREREWASIVSDRANKFLKYAYVEMTEFSKGGDLIDACILTAKNVPSGSQNNASQIRIGIDLALAFQENEGLQLPLFVDNAEGVVDSNLPDVENQMILFYVDEDYPKLTIA